MQTHVRCGAANEVQWREKGFSHFRASEATTSSFREKFHAQQGEIFLLPRVLDQLLRDLIDQARQFQMAMLLSHFDEEIRTGEHAGLHGRLHAITEEKQLISGEELLTLNWKIRLENAEQTA